MKRSEMLGWLIVVSLIVGGLFLLTSCSSNNGAIGELGNKPNNTDSDQNFRLLKVGDYWVYRLSGYSSAPWGATYFGGSRVIEVTDSIKDPQGRTYYVLKDTITVTVSGIGGGSYSSSNQFFFRQDGTGTFFLRGGVTGGGSWWLLTPYEVPFLLSPMKVGQKHEVGFTYENGIGGISYSVDEQEKVEIKGQMFTAFIVFEEMNLPNWEELRSRTRWYVPTIGAPIKEEYTITTYVAGSLVKSTYSFYLSDYHLAGY